MKHVDEDIKQGTQWKSADKVEQESVSIQKLTSGNAPMKAVVIPSQPAGQKLIMPEDIDFDNPPPDFPPAPPKPAKFNRATGTEDEYKQFMRERLAYEEWQNRLLVWHRKNAQNKV
eukprot:TRINITY_DN1744_c0_g1_i5.p3 TRINITY_DN1744_c0_g1~~TRINITY_DN1744_c0_g1_i5.p3  ORF type:complete len:116 (+),score=40.40 TRINITY_DN1744_c0_g1_i5:1124-1471(+)